MNCPHTREAGTRSRIYARFMAPGHERPPARRGGAPWAEGRSPRSSGDVCAEPLRLESSPATRGVPSSGAGPSQNGTCSGGGIGRKGRARRSAVNYVRFGRTRVRVTPISLHREEIISGGDKIYIPLRRQKIDLFQVWGRSVGRRGQLLAP